ncbi:hypothetical protein [Aeromonas rivipollensis]|uniref:hypothetical protein n=1 Tax=Aeromonas rivipollensis TaxID=948519 RepID=UPI0038D183DE
MNIGKRFKCNICGEIIDCRIGMSNRDVQPFQFACPNCEERITFVLGSSAGRLEGAEEIVNFDGPFKGEYPFIDLHLDFPVDFGKYKLGETTFFKVLERIGHEAFGDLSLRLDILNRLYKKENDLRRLITQYIRGDIRGFDVACKAIDIPNVKLKTYEKQDILAALYSATSIMSSPFTIHEHNKELSTEFPETLKYLCETHFDETRNFISEIISKSFLKNLHHDCLKLYPKMVALDLPLRPALYYDYLDKYDIGLTPARVSAADFDTCNNLYKDLAEVFSRQLTLVAGINNLIKRGDHNLFNDSVRFSKKKKEIIKCYSSLDQYADVDLGKKLEAIDDSFYRVDLESIDNRLRNGIAHYKYEYKESTQLIKIYPTRDGLERKNVNEMYFLEFMRKILILFREVHNINHMIKAIHYFCIFILKIET